MNIVMSPFGPSLPEVGWVPAPRYAMRRACILDAMNGLPRGEIVEVGCGAGALLSEFAARGFDVTGVEMSAEGRRRAEWFAADFDNMTIRETPDLGWENSFSYLFSFDVLEHIEDDAAAFRQWVSWLRPGGTALISVPAHMRLWSSSDEFVGHFRRYSREQVRALLVQAGLVDVSVEAYGFPVSNLIEPLRNTYHGMKLKRGAAARSMKAATENSGVDRDLEARLFSLMTRFPGRQIFGLGLRLQRVFRQTVLGTGWIARGRKIDV